MAKSLNANKLSSFYKIILLGDYNVGKSSIFYRFKDNVFKENTKLTLGTDNHSKVIPVDDRNVTLILWDTVGTERFRTLTRNYFRNAHACFLVFGIDEPDTLTSLTQWVTDTDNFSENALKILIANKSDLRCQTNEDKVKAFAYHHDCDIVFNVSAKTGQGIDEMFHTVAKKLVTKDNHVKCNQVLFEDVHELDTREPKLKCC